MSRKKAWFEPLKKTGGRNNYGRVTARHRGGGHKRQYRLIDFKRNKLEVPAKVATIEYDPNRTTRIALLHYVDGEKRYILAPQGLQVGDMVVSSPNADIKPGNALPLQNIPTGTQVHNVELKPGKGGQMARAAGSRPAHGQGGQAGAPEAALGRSADGAAGLPGHHRPAQQRGAGKRLPGEGRTEALAGKRPHVRGVAMNPVDHPMGGGEGKTSGGRHPCTPWGVPTKGYKTRKPKASDRYIVKHRSKK